MSPSALIPRRDILDMLRHCAPGHSVEEKLHHLWVRYQGRTYRALPLGERGDRRGHVESGTVRQMVLHLNINPTCAQAELPILRLQVERA